MFRSNVRLVVVSAKDPLVRHYTLVHYSDPWGFVGRSLVYKILVNETCYGVIVAGSATKHLPGRTEFFEGLPPLNSLVNNTFYHVHKVNGKYPCHNFTSRVVEVWREKVEVDWFVKYGDRVAGWETLVELPRTGELYVKDGWTEVGVTKGYTCKRIAGRGTDSWSGKRKWNTEELRPKRVLCRRIG